MAIRRTIYRDGSSLRTEECAGPCEVTRYRLSDRSPLPDIPSWIIVCKGSNKVVGKWYDSHAAGRFYGVNTYAKKSTAERVAKQLCKRGSFNAGPVKIR